MVRKSGISKKMHVINFKIEKEPKMKFFDFRAFRKKWQKLSHDKIIFHMLSRAFQNTPRKTVGLLGSYFMETRMKQNYIRSYLRFINHY